MVFTVGRLERTVIRFVGTTKDVVTNVLQHNRVSEIKRRTMRDPIPAQTQIVEKIPLETGSYLDDGLTMEEAHVRLQKFGPNEIRAKPERVRLFFHQFKSLSSISLLGFGVLAIALGKYVDAGIVFSAFIVTGAISSRYQWKSEENYREHIRTQRSVAVLRNGEINHISSIYIVPGDIVYLKPGEVIPADAVVLRSNHLQVRELEEDATYQVKNKQAIEWGSPKNRWHDVVTDESFLYAGSTVIHGTARAIVTTTGKSTRYAQLLKQSKHQQTFTEKRYNVYSKWLTKIGWISLFVVGGVVLAVHLSGAPALQTAASVGTSLIPGGFSLPICLAYWAAIKKTQRKSTGVSSLHHIDHLEDTKCVIISEHAITDELTIRNLWCGNQRFDADDPAPVPLVQAAKLFTNLESPSTAKNANADISIYDKAVNKLSDQVDPQFVFGLTKWQWVDHGDMQDHGLIEMRAFKDEGNRVIEIIRGPVQIIFDSCREIITPMQDLRDENLRGSDPRFVRMSLQDWLADVNRQQHCAVGFACRIRNGTTSDLLQKGDFIWIGAIAFDRKYSPVSGILNRVKDQNLPIFLTVDHCMAEDSDFWQAIESDMVRIHSLSAGAFLKHLGQKSLESCHVWVIHGNEQQRLTVVQQLREHYGEVCFIGCHEQERVYYGAAWMSIEQGVLRGIHDVIDAIEEASDARSRLSRANGLIVSGNISEALYAAVTGIAGFHHAHGPININIITNLIASIGLAVGGQRNGEARQAKDIGGLHKAVVSRGIVTGIISTMAYAIGFWIRGDAIFASTFSFATLILSQLMHALRWGGKEHTEKLTDIAEEGVLVLAAIGALGVLIICIHTPIAAQYFQLTPMVLHEWLAAAALAGGVGPVAAKFEQPIWRMVQAFNRSKGNRIQARQAA